MNRQHRRARRLRGAAVAAILALMLGPLAATPALAEEGTDAVRSEVPLTEQPTRSPADAPDDEPGAAEDPGGTEDPGDTTGDDPTAREEGADPGEPDSQEQSETATGEPPAREPSGEDALPDSVANSPEPAHAETAQEQAAAVPFADQSTQPAPPSKQKRVLENIHTDAVSAYYDSGKLVLQTKADIDGEVGKRLVTRETIFHLADNSASRQSVPSGSQYDFIGPPGSGFWLAPQTQNHELIWPGFSTEDPRLRQVLEGGSLKVRLLEARGPGKAEVYLQESFGPKRVFSSSAKLADWSIGVPQHTHMNWAFTKTGTYTFTFEMEAVINGTTQRAQNDYTFVVGDLNAHTLLTATSFDAEYREVQEGPDAGKAALGEPVTFTAAVESGDPSRPAVGAVQFRDETSGTVLGHAPVSADGTAAFRTAELPSGDHAIVAEFVPSWSTDFGASESEEMALPVSGDAKQRPGRDDTTPVSGSALDQLAAGAGVRVTSPKKTVQAGQLTTAQTTKQELRGDWVSVWLHAAKPVWLGWVQTTTGGNFSAIVPKSTAAGDHRLVLKDRDGALVGWDVLKVTKPSDGGGGNNPGGGGGGGGTAPPPAAPTAPTQQCVPDVTLDHGHIDAFNVSAGGGQAVMQIKEDVTGSQVIREAESVLLRVKEEARGSVPSGINGAPGEGYMLPLSMDPNLIWPGWDTNRTSASGYSDVSINITAVDGPGQVFMATQGSFGGWTPILTNGFALPGTLHEPTPAHTHAAWVFSQKGVYKLTAHAVATNPGNGRSLTTAVHTYVFQVGDVPLGDAFCGVSVDPDAAAAGLAVGDAVKSAGAQAVADAKPKNAKNAANAKNVKKSKKQAGGAGGAGAGGPGGGAFEALLNGEMHPAAIAGVVGGGLLLLSGIVGGTIWYVRRIGASGSSPVAVASVPA